MGRPLFNKTFRALGLVEFPAKSGNSHRTRDGVGHEALYPRRAIGTASDKGQADVPLVIEADGRALTSIGKLAQLQRRVGAARIVRPCVELLRLQFAE